MKSGIYCKDECGGAVRLEVFRYLVLNVSRVSRLHDGVWRFELQQWLEKYFFFK
jgi:hypothetical protein